jgi:prolyl-tRNA synthetase
MKFSNCFIPTTKETPNDATLPSHQFLLRAGFINQEGAGLYNYMPLGKIVLDKIRAVVKEELDNAGCMEVQLGFVTPLELWEQSGRAAKMGKEMLKIKDRKNNDFVLSPTNEEAMVTLVKNRVTSYKDLPLNLYQINTKFRDEARPRFGLMRGREFLMKDGYSFHESVEDMEREFAHMEETYRKIFTRLGLEFRAVAADSGAIGGSGSKEFHVLANSGEDTIVVCDSCEYAANIEAASRKAVEVTDKVTLEAGKVETVNLTSIEEVSEFLKVQPTQTIKAVIKKAIYEEESKIVVFFVRGSDELEETKACNAVDALDIEDASEEDIAKAGLVAGYVGIENLPADIIYVIDNELKNETNMVCGANEVNYHIAGVDVKFEDDVYADLVAVQEGDICSCCSGKLSYTKGIEAGHIFQLGTKYSEALGANFLDSNGKSRPFEMGTYGIGVSRLIAAVIEQSHDDKGCIWTKETAPYMVDVIVSNAKKEDELNAGMKIYEDLKTAGIETIIDDRKKERFGFKMGDFELIGFPYAVVVGKKLADGMVELVDRKTGEKTDVNLDEVVEKIKGL